MQTEEAVAQATESETTGTDLAVASNALPTTLGPPGPAEWQALNEQADLLAHSDLVPRSLRGKKADILVIAMTGRELGIPPMAALNKVYVVEGRPTLAAELMIALVQRAGHEIWVDDEASDATKVVVRAQRRGSGRVETETFHIQDAVTAGLCSLKDGKPYARSQRGNPLPWEMYPKAMMRARAISALCRRTFADVLMGYTYVPEELGAVVNEDGAPIAPPKGTKAPTVVPEPLPEWLNELVDAYGEGEVIDAAETVRQRHNVGAPIKKVIHAANAPEPFQVEIRELLEKTQNPQDSPDSQDDVEDAEVEVTHPCPVCGSECAPWGGPPGGPKWRCTNPDCEGHEYNGQLQPWVSFHNDPWKPGGEIEQMRAAAASNVDSSGEAPATSEEPLAEPPSDSSAGEPPPQSASQATDSATSPAGSSSQPDWFGMIDQALEANFIKWEDIARALASAVAHVPGEFTVPRKISTLEKAPVEVQKFVAEKLDLPSRLL